MCFKTPVIKTGMPEVALKLGASYHISVHIFILWWPPWKYHWWHSTNVCVHLFPVTHKVINRPVSGAPSSEGKQKEAANSCFSKCDPKVSLHWNHQCSRFLSPTRHLLHQSVRAHPEILLLREVPGQCCEVMTVHIALAKFTYSIPSLNSFKDHSRTE